MSSKTGRDGVTTRSSSPSSAGWSRMSMRHRVPSSVSPSLSPGISSVLTPTRARRDSAINTARVSASADRAPRRPVVNISNATPSATARTANATSTSSSVKPRCRSVVDGDLPGDDDDRSVLVEQRLGATRQIDDGEPECRSSARADRAKWGAVPGYRIFRRFHTSSSYSDPPGAIRRSGPRLASISFVTSSDLPQKGLQDAGKLGVGPDRLGELERGRIGSPARELIDQIV